MRKKNDIVLMNMAGPYDYQLMKKKPNTFCKIFSWWFFWGGGNFFDFVTIFVIPSFFGKMVRKSVVV